MTRTPRMTALIGAAILAPPLLAAATVAPAHAAQTAPRAAVVAPAPSAEVAATKSVSIKVQKQQRDYWCAPAAGRALLSRLISSGLPSQSKLAGYMGTKSSGTSNPGFRNGLRKALSTYGSGQYDVVALRPGSQSAFLTNVKAGVGSKKVALAYRVLFGYKPWGSQVNNKTGHLMVVRGYTTGSGTKILWWDPWDNTYHTASLAKSWASVKKGGRYGTVAAKS
ncbi:C39 family peptidase [Spirillospora sp. NPDC048911]|uniref:C39 family peptidase n=1 Tax=Spirillospora sp. NPDC048911 TaxID=3364527 RepID=UPI003711C2FB